MVTEEQGVVLADAGVAGRGRNLGVHDELLEYLQAVALLVPCLFSKEVQHPEEGRGGGSGVSRVGHGPMHSGLGGFVEEEEGVLGGHLFDGASGKESRLLHLIIIC